MIQEKKIAYNLEKTKKSISYALRMNFVKKEKTGSMLH